MVDGMRGVRAVWPAALTGGFVFALGQFICSNYVSVELTDIVASLASAGAMILFLRVWQPSEPLLGERSGAGRPAIAGAATADARHEEEIRRRDDDHADSKKDIWEAFAPYIIIIAVFSIAQIGVIKDALDGLTVSFEWPGLDLQTTSGETPTSQTYNFNWANAAGTLLLVSGLLTMLVLRVSPGRAAKVFGKTLDQLKLATVTVMAVLALAYVMNQSAQTLTIGNWIAGAGGVLAFFSSIIGWLGVAVTGSDTSSNSLFGVLQQEAAIKAGIDPLLLTAGNSSGGVLGKMVSPQNLAIGAAAVGLAGKEGDLFRKVLGWSLIMLLFMCILVYLQSTSVLGWMVPS
jgi:lactate permease